RGHKDPDILEEKPKSVVSGRTLEAIARAEGDAVWHSNRPIADNVKGIKKTAKSAKSATKRTTGKGARSKSRAHLAASAVLHGKPARKSALPDFIPPELALLQDRP